MAKRYRRIAIPLASGDDRQICYTPTSAEASWILRQASLFKF